MVKRGGSQFERWYDPGVFHELKADQGPREPSDGEALFADEDARCVGCGHRGDYPGRLCRSCLRGAS